MLKLIRNETIKVLVRKKLYIFMILSGVVCALMAFSFNLASKDGQSHFPCANGQSFPMFSLYIFMPILAIFCGILSSDMVTSENEMGTLKIFLCAPITRTKLFVSKIFAMFIAIVIMTVFNLVSNYIVGYLLFNNWGTDFGCMYVNMPSDVGVRVTLLIHALSIIPALAFGIACLMASFMASSGGTTIGITLGGVIILQFLSMMKPVAPFIINTYFKLYDFIYIDSSPGKLVLGAVVILLYGIVSYIISMNIFGKKDIIT